MAYPLKFREHVFKVKKEKGLSFRELAEQVSIGIATLMRWARRIEPVKKRDKPSIKINLEALARDVEKYPDAYQRERAVRFKVSRQGIDWALKKLGVTYKKNPSGIRRLTLLPEKPLRSKSKNIKPAKHP